MPKLQAIPLAPTVTAVKCPTCGEGAFRNRQGQLLGHTFTRNVRRGEEYKCSSQLVEVCSAGTKGARP